MNGQVLAARRSKLVVLESILPRVKSTRSPATTKQLHAHIIVSGQSSDWANSQLATSYTACWNFDHARKLFDDLPHKSLFLYNAVIRMYTLNSQYHDALDVFSGMVTQSDCGPSNFTYTFAVKACVEMRWVDFGCLLHGKTFVSGFERDGFVQNALLAFYMACGRVGDAKKVFDEMVDRTVVSWNTMISGCFKNGYFEEAIVVFKMMIDSGIEIDCATVVSVLPVCSHLKELKVGKYVHELVEANGLRDKNIAVSNALVDMYVKCGRLKEARSVVDSTDKRDVVTWTALINGYILNGDTRKALELLQFMQSDAVMPNAMTLSALLSSCGGTVFPKHGRCLHGWSIRHRFESDVLVETALIDMYANCKRMDMSFRLFQRTSRTKTVPWNAILSGCVHNGLSREAIKTFKQMVIEGVEQNPATLNSLLPAYAIVTDMQQVKNIHGYIERSGFLSSVDIATGLIDNYAKAGGLDSAHKLFDSIPMKKRDIIVWSAIIGGYGMHGHGQNAVSLFREMFQSGVKPNEVTFTSVLQACGHSGLVDEGLDLFKLMLKSKQLYPNIDHYTCIVDLLGRAGRLQEAYDLILSMPFAPNHAVWGALLGACVIHEDIELGEIAAKWLFEIEPRNTGNYVLLAKIYSALGRWEDAENVRLMMRGRGLIKTPAHSLVTHSPA
ncbi:hypothetical protein MLD38_001296 [Melastoma candidum]|uniref:Uncharacterized protein n=1 Tax=Melastoma candidum TaxID=119954 RepID=A0ACB9SG49_9MYRT|nr:hypothetical protein MLD38_001296 [Melastoma candidum]